MVNNYKISYSRHGRAILHNSNFRFGMRGTCL